MPPNPPVQQANGTKRLQEYFTLSPVGTHRYWRAVAQELPERRLFGMESLRFDLLQTPNSSKKLIGEREE
jgi:hypothetical protein